MEEWLSYSSGYEEESNAGIPHAEKAEFFLKNKYSYLQIINIYHVGNKNFQWEYIYKCIIKTSVRVIQYLLHEGVVWEFLSILIIISTFKYVHHEAKQNNSILFTLPDSSIHGS